MKTEKFAINEEVTYNHPLATYKAKIVASVNFPKKNEGLLPITVKEGFDYVIHVRSSDFDSGQHVRESDLSKID